MTCMHKFILYQTRWLASDEYAYQIIHMTHSGTQLANAASKTTHAHTERVRERSVFIYELKSFKPCHNYR